MAAIRETERAINDALSPNEPLVMKMQSYLVWEKPRRSLTLFVLFHLLFFYIKFSGQRILFILSTALLVGFIINTWRKRIWPEIRVRPVSPEGVDQWVPMSLGLLSVPEISQYMAIMWHSLLNWIRKWLYLRTHHAFLFCVLNVAVLSCLAIVGRYISGFTLTYLFFASLMVWPSFCYHDIPQKLYMYCEPLFMRLDYYLAFRGKFPAADQRIKSGDDNDDDEEFLPNADPALTAALARAITDSEDEDQSPRTSDPMSHDSYLERYENDLIPEREFLPTSTEMPSVVDQPEDDMDFSDLPKKFSKKRRPRATLSSDTFQPYSTDNEATSTASTASAALGILDDAKASTERVEPDSSNYSVMLSMVATRIVGEEISSALTAAVESLDRQGNEPHPVGVEEKEAVDGAGRSSDDDDDDIEHRISEDFDFLDAEEL